MKLLFALFFATPLWAAAQPPQVPHKMTFAGISLTIRDDARREIQKDVDALTQSPKHFNIKVERAKTYFPIIEKIFEEERVPDDFKFLVLQESALISNAVSVSNAVGFWQFKDFTAMEMGMRVDNEIDERMNIASSSRGAAKYVKKNNFYFNNWVYALQAYQMGAGAVLKSVKDSESGAKHMEITSRTYWYVKKFLAHKIAFENAVKGAGQIQIIAYENRSKKTLADLAKEVSVAEQELRSYNTWAKNGIVPDDRPYIIFIPIIGDAKNIKLPTTIASTIPPAKAEPDKLNISSSGNNVSDDRIKINGISAIRAHEGDNANRLAERAHLDIADFLKWNNISMSDPIKAGNYYLLGKKRTRAAESYHKVVPGESLWLISQRYGVQLRKLKKYNKIDSDRDLKPEMILWLSGTKPKDNDLTVAATETVQLDKTQPFAWAINPQQSDEAPIVNQKFSEPKLVNVKPSVINVEAGSAIQYPLKSDSSATVLSSGNKSVTQHEHTVLAGETLYAIAQQHEVSVMDLVTWNNLNLQQGIKTGQVLKISGKRYEIATQPNAKDLPSIKIVELKHEVKTTDTLYSIARKYGVTIKELMEWNGKKDFSVSVGEMLTINQR